jgi:predicted nucleic acid-binding protein
VDQPQIVREYLSTLSRPQTFSEPQSVSTLVERVHFFQSRFRVAEDSHRVTEKLLELMEQIKIGGKQVHDANIVATMLVYGIPRLLTHNAGDFVRFSQFITVLPLEASS